MNIAPHQSTILFQLEFTCKIFVSFDGELHESFLFTKGGRYGEMTFKMICDQRHFN